MLVTILPRRELRPYLPIQIHLQCDCCNVESLKVECSLGAKNPSEVEIKLLHTLSGWFKFWQGKPRRKGMFEQNLCLSCSKQLLEMFEASGKGEISGLRSYVRSNPSSSNSSSAQPSGSF